MNEWWKFFKEIPTSVKIKYVIAFIPALILYAIYYAGGVAEKLDDAMTDWLLRGWRR